MLAMVLEKPGLPLVARDVPVPEPGPGQIRVRVHACGVCRTDLHIVDGELADPKLPIIPGHEIVGSVDKLGEGVERFGVGDRIGVPWLGWTCGECRYCVSGRENLCDNARFTGYTIDGGYAEYAVADQRYCFPIPEGYPDIQAAPLLCAGLIGYRSLRMTGAAQRLGLYGFGASAHIVAQVAARQGRTVYAFTKPGDAAGQEFARGLGAAWAGGSDEQPPTGMDAAIIFAPVGALVPVALRAVEKGGAVVCAGIHMSDIPSFPYHILWGERAIMSVANLTRQDGEELLRIAPEVPVRTHVKTYTLTQANEALAAIRDGSLVGAAVLVIGC
ncbi:MAG: zinc-dependent alcohol dehydrogenase family protein [Armatimonadetes bacterium]|nr:zinc-dependent alcohol dehydrogenase family protein [Armatimonadota bacterium]